MPHDPTGHPTNVEVPQYGTGRGGMAPAVYWPAQAIIVVHAAVAIAFPRLAPLVL